MNIIQNYKNFFKVFKELYSEFSKSKLFQIIIYSNEKKNKGTTLQNIFQDIEIILKKLIDITYKNNDEYTEYFFWTSWIYLLHQSMKDFFVWILN